MTLAEGPEPFGKKIGPYLPSSLLIVVVGLFKCGYNKHMADLQASPPIVFQFPSRGKGTQVKTPINEFISTFIDSEKFSFIKVC